MKKSIAIIAVEVRDHLGFRASLIKSLVRRGVKVYALASDYNDVTRSEIITLGAEPLDISMVRTGMNPFIEILNTISLAKVLKRVQPDIVLSSFIKPVIYGTVAAWLANIQHRVAMIEGLGYVYTDDGNKPNIKKMILVRTVSALYRFALSRADRIVFLNADDLNDFSRWKIINPNKAVMLGGIGVDLEEWQPTKAIIEPVRFLFVARLLREKGIEEFLAASRLVKRSYPDSEFVVLGALDVNPGAIHLRQIQEWVDAGVGLWPGYVSVGSWIKQTSVFVLPSYYREGVPRSSQEAMSMARPVITTDTPGCRDTVIHGVNGFLVPVRDEVALAEAMIRFIEEPELITRMGYQSRRIAEERFDAHKFNTRLIEVLVVD